MTDPEKGFITRITSSFNKKGILVSRPLEDMAPFLPREEFRADMIVKTVNDEE